MANLNKVFLMGNLTRDPELRYTPSGVAVTDFGLAVNRSWKSQNGEKREEVTFVDVQAWARTAEVISEYCKKGSPIFVEGRLQYDSWEGKDGQKRSRLRVVAETFQFIGAPSGRRSPDGSAPARPAQRAKLSEQPSAAEPPPFAGPAPAADDVPPADGPYKVDDDIPF